MESFSSLKIICEIALVLIMVSEQLIYLHIYTKMVNGYDCKVSNNLEVHVENDNKTTRTKTVP